MSEEADGFEECEVAVGLLEKFQNAIENKSISGMLIQEWELQCLLNFIQDLQDEIEELES